MRGIWGVGLSAVMVVAGQAVAAPAASSSLLGQWGGDRAQMTFTVDGAQLDLECAAGMIPVPVRLGSAGRFDTLGSFEQQHGGPQRVDAQPSPAQVRYAGQLEGGTLTLQIWPTAGEAPLVFRLRKGAQVKMIRCY